MIEPYHELLLGCGRSREKRIWPANATRRPGDTQFGPGLVTLDVNLQVQPDLWCDLNSAPPWYVYPRAIETSYRDTDSMVIPEGKEIQHGVDLGEVIFKPIGWHPAFNIPSGPAAYQVAYALLDDYWDEIHAYDVLEHLGAQGDAAGLLRQFAELWRILKPNGYLCCTVPSRFSLGLWGDPSHRRVINPMTLTFLDQGEYIRQCDSRTPSSMSDFRGLYKADFRCVEAADNRETFSFVLQAVKPSRWGEPT